MEWWGKVKFELEFHTPPESKTLYLDKGDEIKIVGWGQKGVIHNLTTVPCRVKSYSATKNFYHVYISKETRSYCKWPDISKNQNGYNFPWFTKPQNIMGKGQSKTFSSHTVPDKLSPAFLIFSDQMAPCSNFSFSQPLWVSGFIHLI